MPHSKNFDLVDWLLWDVWDQLRTLRCRIQGYHRMVESGASGWLICRHCHFMAAQGDDQ